MSIARKTSLAISVGLGLLVLTLFGLLGWAQAASLRSSAEDHALEISSRTSAYLLNFQAELETVAFDRAVWDPTYAFALDGPEKCSGLPVRRYAPEQLAEELGPAFELREARRHVHTTPWGSTQSFQYSRLQRCH